MVVVVKQQSAASLQAGKLRKYHRVPKYHIFSFLEENGTSDPLIVLSSVQKQIIGWLEKGCATVWKFDPSLFHEAKFITIVIQCFSINDFTCHVLPSFVAVDPIHSNMHAPVTSKKQRAAM